MATRRSRLTPLGLPGSDWGSRRQRLADLLARIGAGLATGTPVSGTLSATEADDTLRAVGLVGIEARGHLGFVGTTTGGPVDAADIPSVTLKTILTLGDKTAEGRLVEVVSVAWFEIVRRILKNRDGIYEIDARMWEEIIAGAYHEAGFEDVILTPRSGDKGRDVIATKKGLYTVRFIDQVKAYKPGHVVTADEVRSLIGTLDLERNASKAVLTTTSTFAPRLREVDKRIAELEPYRLELKDADALLPWLEEIQAKRG